MRTKSYRPRRPLGEKRYKKLFIIATEGQKTEPQYFNIFNRLLDDVQVTLVPSRHGSAPQQVLDRLKRHLAGSVGSRRALRSPYEAWLVVDKNSWSKEQLAPLYQWSRTRSQYGFALSNPKFEYWLLLHFEEGSNINSARECSERLKKHLPDYNKGVDPQKFTLDCIRLAVSRAEARSPGPSEAWPNPCGTTVYRLVRNILQTQRDS